MAAGAYIAIEPRDPRTFTSGLIPYPEAASLTIKKGTPVVIDTNGRIDAASATFTSIYGISAEDGHNGTAGQYEILVWPIHEGTQWKVALLEALTQTTIGDTLVGFVKDATTGLWYASTADGGAQGLVVDYVRGPAGMNIGDTKAPVYVIFKTTKFQVT